MKLKWGNKKLYQNKEWLKNKYINEKLPTTQISKICYSTISTIKYWLKKFNIPIRSISEAQHLSRGNHCSFSIEAIHWINGELLGDGCLESCSSYSARFHYASKYKEYAQYVSNKLKSFGIKRSGKIYRQYIEKDNCYIYCYNSLSYAELLYLRNIWYPEGIKIVPKGLILSPLTVRQWYIGDGCLRHPKKQRPSIMLSTDSY